jgi:hypothetical protein
MSAPGNLVHEIKYRLPAAAAAAARVLLSGVCRPERPHAEGVVHTVYLDTPEHRSREEKLASEYLKTKVRVRWYEGSPGAWIEVKRRIGSRRAKRRALLPFPAAALGAAPLASPRLAATELALRLGEPLELRLRPVLHLRYRRARFELPAFGARLALDTEIRALARAGRCEPAPRALDVAIVEVKGGSRELPAPLAPLAALGAVRASFSKYAAAWDAAARPF